MSSLSFPVDELSRLRVCIRVLPSGRFSFDVQSSAFAEAPNSGTGGFSSSYSVVFETLDDGEAHILRVYTTLNSGHAQAANHYQGASEGSNASAIQFTNSTQNNILPCNPGGIDMSFTGTDYNTLSANGVFYEPMMLTHPFEWPPYNDDMPAIVSPNDDEMHAASNLEIASRAEAPTANSDMLISPSPRLAIFHPGSPQLASSVCTNATAAPPTPVSSAPSPPSPLPSNSCPSPSTSNPSPSTSNPSPSTSNPSPSNSNPSPSPPPSSSPTPAPGKRKRTLPCPQCARRFANEYTLSVHARTHRPKAPRALPCTLGCAEHFSRQHDRLRHEVVKHGRVCEWACPHCRKFFSSARTLANHLCQAPGAPTRWEVN